MIFAEPRIARTAEHVAQEHHAGRALEDRPPGGSSSAGSRAGRRRARSTGRRRAAGRPGAVRLSSPSVTAAISAMPLDSPSRPSMKFRLLIMPTIQTTVNAIPTGDGEQDVARPERVADEGDDDPRRDGDARERELAEELPARAEVEPVVEGADDGGQDRAAEQADEVHRRDRRVAGHAREHRVRGATIPPPTSRKAIDDRDAPAARERPVVDPPRIGVVEDPVALHVARRIERRREERDERRERRSRR